MEEPKVSLINYFIPQKVRAFARSYTPCDSELSASDVFTDAKLRKYFQAYPIPGMGDLLIAYIDALDEEGFHLQTSITGEPAIFATANTDDAQMLLDMLSLEQEDSQTKNAAKLVNP